MTIDPPPAQFSAATAPTDESPALVARRDAFRINGLEFDYGCNPIEGEVHWDPVRSLFNGTMLLLAMTLGPMYFSWPAVAVFLVLCFFTLCCGHSVGFHRRMIHRSFKCPKWLCADTSARRCCSDQAARP